MNNPSDTATHRIHILQANMQQIVQWTQLLQTQRAAIVEKLVRVKANNKIARATTVSAQLSRSIASLTRDLTSVETKLNKVADKLNKCRGLFLELTDGDMLLEKTEQVHGNPPESETDRGTTEASTTGPEIDSSSLLDSGEAEGAASTDHGDGGELRPDAGPVVTVDTEDGSS